MYTKIEILACPKNILDILWLHYVTKGAFGRELVSERVGQHKQGRRAAGPEGDPR